MFYETIGLQQISSLQQINAIKEGRNFYKLKKYEQNITYSLTGILFLKKIALYRHKGKQTSKHVLIEVANSMLPHTALLSEIFIKKFLRPYPGFPSLPRSVVPSSSLHRRGCSTHQEGLCAWVLKKLFCQFKLNVSVFRKLKGLKVTHDVEWNSGDVHSYWNRKSQKSAEAFTPRNLKSREWKTLLQAIESQDDDELNLS